MKYIIVVALFLCACGQSTAVISAVGNVNEGRCIESVWMTCVAKKCPYGYIVIVESNNLLLDNGIIKCKTFEEAQVSKPSN
jgi:hypothetical protein